MIPFTKKITLHNLIFKSGAIILLILILVSCKKQWLDAKSNKGLVIPTTITDFQGLLDNTGVFTSRTAILSEISADNYYLESSSVPLLNIVEQNTYKWAADIFEGNSTNDWSKPYQRIFYANVILEGIEKSSAESSIRADWKNVKGGALFHRAHSFYNLVQEFAPQYNAATANTDLGVPIRLSSDIDKKSVRATVQENYDQIISDLVNASPLLPVTPLYKTRPSKPATLALLARTYLVMANYDKALLYADSALQLYNQLIDFKTLDPMAQFPVSLFNSEVIFHTDAFSVVFNTAFARADTNLYKLYDVNDLRRIVFYTSTSPVRFKGHYTGSSGLFSGIATDEIYLIRAEAYARKGDMANALNNLNTLLVTRWKAGTFQPVTATSAGDALNKVLLERRKELAFRAGLRWTDLRRLNKEGANITLQRVIDNQTITLPPNDKRYTLPIPEDEIRESGIQQNPR